MKSPIHFMDTCLAFSYRFLFMPMKICTEDKVTIKVTKWTVIRCAKPPLLYWIQ
jgi:hypothetical protein